MATVRDGTNTGTTNAHVHGGSHTHSAAAPVTIEVRRELEEVTRPGAFAREFTHGLLREPQSDADILNIGGREYLRLIEESYYRFKQHFAVEPQTLFIDRRIFMRVMKDTLAERMMYSPAELLTPGVTVSLMGMRVEAGPPGTILGMEAVRDSEHTFRFDERTGFAHIVRVQDGNMPASVADAMMLAKMKTARTRVDPLPPPPPPPSRYRSPRKKDDE